jgi:hypothetical protein
MSEIRGPLSAVAAAIVYPIEQHQRLTPPQKALAHVSLAAHFVGWCGYLAPVFYRGQFVGALLRLQLHAPDEVWISVAAWAGLSVIAVLWLLAAMKAAHAPRSPGTALWRLLLGGACAWLLWNEIYPDVGPYWGPLAVFVLKGFYIAWLVSHVARFLVAAQLIGGGNALRTINREIRRRNAPVRPVRPRRFFFW